MKIVFTNGCFDVLHAGHVQFLERARALGDLLIVAVNTDSSVAALKGEGRPVNSLPDRMTVLRAIRWVDAVIPFADLTAEALIRGIRPTIFVKGRGTGPSLEAQTAREVGASVVLIDGPQCSSTAIIDKIRRSA